MKIFKTVAEVGQFTRAARNLRLSKSAVSQAISDLESYLGSRLITRDNRNFQLTEAGTAYYEECTRILADIAELEDEMRNEKGVIQGQIHLTAPITYGVRVLAPIIAEFLRRNRNVELNLSLSESNMDLVQAGIDVAIRIGNLPDSSMIMRHLSETQMILCASPDFIAAHSPIHTLADLSGLNCFRYRWTPKWIFTLDGKTSEFVPCGSVISDSGEALLQLAIGGNGVCYLPDFICGEAVLKGQLVPILPRYKAHSIAIQAVFPPHRHMPARVRRLIDFLAETYASPKLI
ncbi:MAG: LysR family transcriptional regulator [Hyphomonadaceae bacterium]|nr:LysR family transcriptional regulator [Hyphomonadaceae bacterium]